MIKGCERVSSIHGAPLTDVNTGNSSFSRDVPKTDERGKDLHICHSFSHKKKGEPGVAVHQGRAQHPKALKVSLCEMEEMFEIHGHRAGLCAKTKSVFVT